jgi:hypothetical protein
MFAVAMSSTSSGGQSTDRMDAYIRTLPAEQRAFLIENYVAAGWSFLKFLKFRHTPAIYLSCPDKGCDPLPVSMLEDLRAQAPKAFGNRIAEKDAAQIEIYLAPKPTAFEARDRAIDGEFHLNVNITTREFPFPKPREDAPCWTITYFDKMGVIAKTLVFINSDSSPRMQYLCMGFESVRATGVMNLPSVYFYRDLERHQVRYPIQWLAANAYLHGSLEIQPGDTMENVRAVLKERYELK